MSVREIPSWWPQAPVDATATELRSLESRLKVLDRAEHETLEVSRRVLTTDAVVMGCAFLGRVGGADDDERCQAVSNAAVSAAVDAGIVEFDTAPLYFNGKRERQMAEALRALPASKAALVRVATKVGRLVRGTGILNDYTASGAKISLAESLGRMGLNGVHTLRIHDPNDSPERPEGVDEVGIALAPGGMIPELVAMREAGTIRCVSLGMNSNVETGPGGAVALPPSLTSGVPAEIVRLLRGAPRGTFDEALLAGGWTLLTQAALPAMLECQRRGVEVAVAAVFCSGLLVGRTTYAYQAAPSEKVQRAQRWRELADEYGLSLPAVALAFAYLPSCVSKVVIGMGSAEEVASNLEAIRESATVPAALWYEARARGLLGPEVPLPAV